MLKKKTNNAGPDAFEHEKLFINLAFTLTTLLGVVLLLLITAFFVTIPKDYNVKAQIQNIPAGLSTYSATGTGQGSLIKVIPYSGQVQSIEKNMRVKVKIRSDYPTTGDTIYTGLVKDIGVQGKEFSILLNAEPPFSFTGDKLIDAEVIVENGRQSLFSLIVSKKDK